MLRLGVGPKGRSPGTSSGLLRFSTPIYMGHAGTNTNADLTTGTFTPPANCLLVSASVTRANAALEVMSHSGGSLTWTQRANGYFDLGSGTRGRLVVSTAPVGASPAPMTVTSAKNGTVVNHILGVLAIPNGAFVQAAADPGPNNGDASTSLADAPAAGNMSLGFFLVTGTSATPVPTNGGYTRAFYNLTAFIQLDAVYSYGAQSVAWVTGNTTTAVAALLNIGKAA